MLEKEAERVKVYKMIKFRLWKKRDFRKKQRIKLPLK
jgi:hypothetical protein